MDDRKFDSLLGDNFKAISQVLKHLEIGGISRVLRQSQQFMNVVPGLRISEISGLGQQFAAIDSVRFDAFKALNISPVISSDMMRSITDIGRLMRPMSDVLQSIRIAPALQMPRVIPTIEALKPSPLFDYLSSSLGSEAIDRFVRIEGAAAIKLRASGEGRVISPEPSTEEAIVEQLRQGADPATLSTAQKNYLLRYIVYLYCVLEVFLTFYDVYKAYEDLSQKLLGVTTSQEVRSVVREEVTDEQRELLADYRVVMHDGLRLRGEPSKDSKAVGLLRIGSQVEVLSTEGNWIFVAVESDGETRHGWIARSSTLPIKSKSYLVDEGGGR